MPNRYSAAKLVDFARVLLERTGLEADKARVTAEVLVEGDLLGHDTHGLALLAPYLLDIEEGRMTTKGTPDVLADYPSAVTWDGKRLPGPWLVRQAFDLAVDRSRRQGTCAVAIRRSHHIACLGAYLRSVAEQGFVAVVTSSDPTARGVAPHGGRDQIMTPNPIAAAWPTEDGPVLLDISTSITTNGMTKRLAAEGRRFPDKWGLDASGSPTDAPKGSARKRRCASTWYLGIPARLGKKAFGPDALGVWRAKRNVGLAGDAFKMLDDVFGQMNAIFSADRFRFTLGVAGQQRP